MSLWYTVIALILGNWCVYISHLNQFHYSFLSLLFHLPSSWDPLPISVFLWEMSIYASTCIVKDDFIFLLFFLDIELFEFFNIFWILTPYQVNNLKIISPIIQIDTSLFWLLNFQKLSRTHTNEGNSQRTGYCNTQDFKAIFSTSQEDARHSFTQLISFPFLIILWAPDGISWHSAVESND